MKISMVSYINAKPFLLGMEETGMIDTCQVHLDIPSETARKLVQKEVDIALVPVAALPEVEEPHIITDYAIGAIGKVASVQLFSEVPIEDISRIYLDYQSRTSVNLLKVLLKTHWKKEVEFIDAFPGYEKEIGGSVAGLIIGDRAILGIKDYRYQYDLAEEWQKCTNLPFVFAVWVSNGPISSDFEDELNQAFSSGLKQINRLIEFYQEEFGEHIDVNHYFKENISYSLDPEKYKAIDLFLSKMKNLDEDEIKEFPPSPEHTL